MISGVEADSVPSERTDRHSQSTLLNSDGYASAARPIGNGSTGVLSGAGKKRASSNAYRHGLAVRFAASEAVTTAASKTKTTINAT